MIEWERIEPTKTDKIGWRTIVTKTFKMPDGQTMGFSVVGNEDVHCTATIALTKDQQVIIARQFRPGPEKVMNELPGGGVENGETPEAAAIRELQEETGYVAGSISLLGTVHKDAYNNGLWHYFIATDCELHPDGEASEDTEFIDVVLMTIPEFIESAKSGMMTDTEALFFAYEKLKELQNVPTES